VLFFMGLGADIRAQDINKTMALLNASDSASLDHRSQ
jgi:hypothetical protein